MHGLHHNNKIMLGDSERTMTNNIPQTQTTQTPQLPIEMLKEKEKLLWEEVRSIREVTLKMLQWSVTALASLQTAIFFLRKDIYERMLAAKQLLPGEYLPWDKYLRGTLFLFVVAIVFAFLLVLTGNRYRKMRAQLIASNLYQIDHGDVTKSARWIMLLVLFVFPLMDVILHVSFR